MIIMTTNESYAKALKLIKEGKILLSLKEAEKLPFERFLDFVFYCREKHQNKLGKSIFWTALFETRYYLPFFNSPNSYLFLSSLFKLSIEQTTAIDLIVFLADNQSECLIKSIRVSKSFLNDEWFQLFEKTLSKHPNKELRAHFQCFSLLKQIEKALWRQVEEKGASLNSVDHSPISLLNELALWYNLKTEFRESREMQTNVETLNSAVEYLSRNNLLQIEDFITNENLAVSNATALGNVRMCEKSHKVIPVFEWLDQVKIWNAFMNNKLQLYCFDLNYEPEISNEGIIYLKPISIEKVKKWENVGFKINLMFDFYHQTGEDVFNEAKLNGNIKGQKDKSINHLETDFVDIVRFSAENAWFNTFSDNNIRLQKGNIDFLTISHFFGEYSGNCLFRWHKPIVEKQILSKSKSSINIEEVWAQNIRAGRDIQWLRHDSYNRLIHKINERDIKIDSSEILDFLVCNQNASNDSTKKFDRFLITINLFSKPFMKFGDNLFVFTSIIANTRPFTFLFDNLLNQNKDKVVVKNLSDKFEDRICKQFEMAGFATNFGNDKIFVNNLTDEKGDFDALAYKNGYLFVIEAKLAPIRIDLNDIHNELSSSFLKGASQLNKALKYIEFRFVDIKKSLGINEDAFHKLKIFPLIVSTSFESDHNRIDWGKASFLKISWHELMLILNNEKNPQRIIDIIEKETVWDILDSLHSPSITENTIAIGSLSLVVQPNSQELFDKIIELFDLERFSEAIIFLRQAIKLNENNVDFYLMLGDCYAELKDFESAKIAYETALKKDPFYSKSYNSFGCLWQENKKWDISYQYFKKAIQLNPLDEVIQNSFYTSLCYLVDYGLKTKVSADAEWVDLSKRIEQINFLNLLQQIS
jgi:tetratricopeptide (TPR) repeat protein